jgi:hypothetical protein
MTAPVDQSQYSSCLLQIIYVARDAKDVAVSYYHHHRLFFGYSGSIEDFFEALLAEIGKVIMPVVPWTGTNMFL